MQHIWHNSVDMLSVFKRHIETGAEYCSRPLGLLALAETFACLTKQNDNHLIYHHTQTCFGGIIT